MKAVWGHFSGFGKLLLLTLLVFLSFMAFSLLAWLVALPFVNGVSLSGEGAMSLSLNMLRYFQVVQSFSVFIIPSLLAGFLFWGHFFRGLQFRFPRADLLVLSLLIIVVTQPLVSYLGEWNSSMSLPEIFEGMEQWMQQAEESANGIIYRFLATDNTRLLLLNFLMIAILPALGEEMLFRGAIQPVFREWFRNGHLAVWITAFLFSAIHLQFFTFMPRFLLGLLLGYLMLYGKNIWYPIAGHFANNFLSLIIFYYYRHTNPEINPLEPNSEEFSFVWVFPAIFVLAIIGRTFVVRAKKQ